MTDERKRIESKASESDTELPEQQEESVQADPPYSLVPIELETLISTFLDITSQAALARTSKEMKHVVEQGRIVEKDLFEKQKKEKLFKNWQREDEQGTYKKILEILNNEKGAALLATGLISRSDIEREVRRRWNLNPYSHGWRGMEAPAYEVAETLKAILALPQFESLCTKRLLNPAWLALSPQGVESILIDTYFNALEKHLFQQFPFASSSAEKLNFFKMMLDPNYFPAFESKLVTYDQAMEIGDTPKSYSTDQEREDAAQAMRFLGVLLSPSGKQALQEHLIDIPTALRICTSLYYHQSSSAIEVSFGTGVLQSLLSENGLKALRNHYIDIEHLSTLFSKCRQPTRQDHMRAFEIDHKLAIETKDKVVRLIRSDLPATLFSATECLQDSVDEKESKLTPQRDSLLKLGKVTWDNKGIAATILTEQCKALCSRSGIEALEHTPPLITWNQACYFSPDGLNALLCPNGINALKENAITLETAVDLIPANLNVFFQHPNSVKALRNKWFDVDVLKGFKNWERSRNFELILSDAGLKLLEQGQISTSEALLCSPRHLEFILSEKAAPALDPEKGWIKPSDIIKISSSLLDHLASDIAAEAFKEGLITAKILESWNKEQLMRMLSPNGILAMRLGLIPATEVTHIAPENLIKLTTGRGLIALSEGAIQLEHAKRMNADKLTEALKTHNIALKILELRTAGQRETLALLPPEVKIQADAEEKQTEQMIRQEQVELDTELVSRLKNTINKIRAEDVKDEKQAEQIAQTEMQNIQNAIFTLAALQSRHTYPPEKVDPKDVIERQMRVLNQAFYEIVVDRIYFDLDKKQKLLASFKNAYTNLVDIYLKGIKPSGTDLEKFTTLFVNQGFLIQIDKKTLSSSWNKPISAVPHHAFFKTNTATSKAIMKKVEAHQKQLDQKKHG